MPHYYFTDYVAAPLFQNAVRPRGAEQAGWSAVDFRPNVTGTCLLAVPNRNDLAGQLYVGSNPDAVLTSTMRRSVGDRFGVTLTATTLRAIVSELLTIHARTDGTRWRPVEPAQGRREVWLHGDRFWSQ